MNAQIFTTPNGERMVMLPEADYQLLLAAAEDAADSAAVRAFRERLEAGEEELLPAAMVERLLAGESPIRVWREHRGLSVSGLAQAAGLSQPYLSQIETGARRPAGEKLERIAQALHVQSDDLV
ncbi:helix-turn-helix domain-containing protein [Bosea sp. UC22_33]|uniref:helix-turn-helix domain-containing protein n=1 Tax=Bosea sp. UC22_33 TaxID=3350165 RepID=UPI00366BE5AC